MNKTILDIASEIGSGITPLRSNNNYWLIVKSSWTLE